MSYRNLPSDGWPGMGAIDLALTEDEMAHLLRNVDNQLWWAKNKRAFEVTKS